MAAVESGTGAYVVASVFQVSVSYIYKALGRRRTTGETSARPWAGGPKPKLAAHDEAVRDRVMRKPDATLAELQAWLIEERGTKVSVGSLWKRLRRLGLTLKKNIARRAEQDRPDVAEAREEWRASQPDLNPEHLVFIEALSRRFGLAVPLAVR